MKAMIFAAGLGTRLKPITESLPKALVPVDGKPLLEHTLRKIMSAGIDETVINVHHFADKIEAWLQSQEWISLSDKVEAGKMSVYVSDERNLLLETGGAILYARPFLEKCGRFLVHNVDILSDCNLEWFVSQVRSDAVATLLVSRRKSTRSFLFDPETMQLVGWKNNTTGECIIADGVDPDVCVPYAFSGIHILSDEIFPLMEKYLEGKGIIPDQEHGVRFPIRDFYLWASAERPIYGVVSNDMTLMDVGKLDALAPAEDFVRSLRNR